MVQPKVSMLSARDCASPRSIMRKKTALPSRLSISYTVKSEIISALLK